MSSQNTKNPQVLEACTYGDIPSSLSRKCLSSIYSCGPMLTAVGTTSCGRRWALFAGRKGGTCNIEYQITGTSQLGNTYRCPRLCE